MTTGVIIGRLLQSNARGFRFACTQKTISLPRIGDLVSAEIGPDLLGYGIITDILWLSDELIAQLARAENIERGVVTDNQFQRAAGQYIEVLSVGYRDTSIHHALPPRPPLSLEQIRLCSAQEIIEFSGPSYTYFRLLLEAQDDIPINDVVAAHLVQAHTAHHAGGSPDWILGAVDNLIELLVDDYAGLTGVLEAMAQIDPGIQQIFKE